MLKKKKVKREKYNYANRRVWYLCYLISYCKMWFTAQISLTPHMFFSHKIYVRAAQLAFVDIWIVHLL